MSAVIPIGQVLQGNLLAAPTTRAGSMLPAPISYRPDVLPAGLAPSVMEAALMLCDPEREVVAQLGSKPLSKALLQPLEVVPFLLGHSNTLISGKDLAVMATAVAEMIQRDFPMLTLGEVGLAFRRGASGEWKKEDEVELAALPTFRKWLKCYSQGSRATAISLLHKATDQQQQRLFAPPPINYPKEVADLAAWATDHATPKHPAGLFPEPLDQGNILYDWLKKVGAFDGFKTKEQYTLMLRKEALIRSKQPPAGLEEYRHGRAFKDHLRAGAWPESHPFADSIVNACRKRLLKEWIFYHLGRGTDIEQHLHQLRERHQHRQSAAA